MIEPPTIEAADDQVLLCSTECPHAHGQTFDTPSGEVRLIPPFPPDNPLLLTLTLLSDSA